MGGRATHLFSRRLRARTGVDSSRTSGSTSDAGSSPSGGDTSPESMTMSSSCCARLARLGSGAAK